MFEDSQNNFWLEHPGELNAPTCEMPLNCFQLEQHIFVVILATIVVMAFFNFL